jgi:Tfp pilus assembly protein FimT
VQKIKASRGSLLVDWSTALSVAATAAMVAVPGLKTFVHESQRSAVVNEIQFQVRKAALAANERGQTISLCASALRSEGCADSADWSGGWTAFVDLNGDGAMQAGETRLWSTRNEHRNIAVAAAPAVFSFRPFYARPYNHGTTPGQLTVCDREGSGGTRSVVVDRAGIPRLSEARSSAGGCHA